jgi:hypothetical protein
LEFSILFRPFLVSFGENNYNFNYSFLSPQSRLPVPRWLAILTEIPDYKISGATKLHRVAITVERGALSHFNPPAGMDHSTLEHVKRKGVPMGSRWRDSDSVGNEGGT